MIVVGAPAAGDMLQAHKPIKPNKEIHAKGFKDIFHRKMEELKDERKKPTQLR